MFSTTQLAFSSPPYNKLADNASELGFANCSMNNMTFASIIIF